MGMKLNYANDPVVRESIEDYINADNSLRQKTLSMLYVLLQQSDDVASLVVETSGQINEESIQKFIADVKALGGTVSRSAIKQVWKHNIADHLRLESDGIWSFKGGAIEKRIDKAANGARIVPAPEQQGSGIVTALATFKRVKKMSTYELRKFKVMMEEL